MAKFKIEKTNRDFKEASVMQRIFSVSIIVSLMILIISLVVYTLIVANNNVNGEYFSPFSIIRYVKVDSNLGFDVNVLNLLLAFVALTFLIYFILRILYHSITKKPIK